MSDVSGGPVRQLVGTAERDVQRAVCRGVLRLDGGSERVDVQWRVHGGLQLSRGVDVADAEHVSSRAVQPCERRRVYAVCSGSVRRDTGDAERVVQWPVLGRLLWQHIGLDDTDLQRRVCSGLLLPCGVYERHSSDLQCGSIQLGHDGRLHVVCGGSVRRDDWAEHDGL